MPSRVVRRPFRRLWLAVALSLGLVACLYVLLFAHLARQHHAELRTQCRERLRDIVLVSRGALAPVVAELRAGSLSVGEARRRAAELVWNMRYPDAGFDNYVFLMTFEGVPLVDPVHPDVVGVSQWDVLDPSGTHPVRELVRTAREHPRGGYISYLYRRPGGPDVLEEKISFVVPVPEMGCLLGSGVFVADLEATARRDALNTGLLVAVLFVLGFVPLSLPLREAVRRNAALKQEIVRHESTELSLRQAESRYRMISSRPGQVVYDVDLTSGRTVWTGDAEGVSGHTLEEYASNGGRFISANIHPEERDTVQSQWRETLRQGGQWNAVFRLQHKNGNYVYVEDHAGFMSAESGGEPVRVIGSLRNVDALVRAGEEVRRSEAKYRALAENFPNGAVLLYDENLRFVLADGAGLKSVGFSDGGMIGRTPAEVFPPSVARTAEQHFRKALLGEEHVFEMTYAGRIFKLHALPVRGERSEDDAAEGMAVIQDVTANKLAEKALSESERRLSTLIMNMPGMVYRSAFHSDWTLEFVSPGCRMLTGYGPESLLYNRAKSWDGLVHPDDRDQLKREIARALAEERPFELSYRIRTKSGDEKWVWERGVGISVGDGVPVIEGIILDVTDRKRAEEGLARSLAYETVLNSCATLLLSSARQKDALEHILEELRLATNTSRAYVFENLDDAAMGLCYRLAYESSSDDVLQLRSVPQLGKAAYDEIIPRWRKVFERGEAVMGDMRDFPEEERQALARYTIKSLLALPLRVEGRWSGFIGFDDTRNERTWGEAERLFLRTAADMIGASMERQRAEQRLLQAHAELDQIFNSTGDGMALIGLDGTVQRINRTMAEMFGLDPKTAQGRPCKKVIPDDRCGAGICPLSALQAGIERTDHVFCQPADDGGRRHFRSVSTPFRDVKGEVVGVVVSTREITQRVRAQEESKERERQLIQADKLAALGTLVSGVAHEINNPNGIITLNAPTLRDIWKGTRPILEERYDERGDFLLGEVEYSVIREEADALFEQIVESARRIKRIVAELKGFARQDVAGRDQIVNLDEVARAAVGLVANKIKKCTNRFEARWSEQPVRVLGNFQRLEQVLVNALINACEALTSPEQAVVLEVGVSPDGEYGQITVTDEGKGMAQEEIRHVFEPFFTTKRDSGGTGLGLSVSHGIIEEHGGRMFFNSEQERGTVCTVQLPLLVSDGEDG